MSTKRTKTASTARPTRRADQKPGQVQRRWPLRQVGLAAALAVVVTVGVLATHWPALSAEALSFDDTQYLTENPLVQNPGWTSARRFFAEVLEPSTVEGYYQPLTMVSLMLDYALGGRPDHLGPFHRTSLALHAGNTVLVMVLLYLLFGQVWVAALVGLLFGAHPLTVEPIPWVSERKTLLASFFALSSLVLYVVYARNGRRKFYGVALTSYVLALLAKPTTVPLPALLLLLDYWPMRRLNRRSVVEKLPFFLIGGIAAVITYVSQSRTSSAILPGQYPTSRIPLVVCHNIVFYLYKIIWPTNLTSHYPFPEPLSFSHPAVAAGVGGTLLLLAGLAISLRWTPALLTGWLFFFIAIFPTMGVITFTNVIACDKYAYLPAAGLLMTLAWSVGRLWSPAGRARGSTARRASIVIIALALAAAEARATRRYLTCWRDTETLCRRVLHYAPKADVAHMELGIVLADRGGWAEAMMHFTEAVKLAPYRPKAQYNLGLAWAKQGQIDQATAHFAEAVELRPDYFDARCNLATALAMQGRIDDAAIHAAESVRLRPDSAGAHHVLADILALRGQSEQAVAHYRRALQLEPGQPTVAGDLAWILATSEDPQVRHGVEAVRLAQQACRATGFSDPGLLDTLAAAYAEAGQFNDAIQAIKEAISRVSAAPGQASISELQQRLELYDARRPYRDTHRSGSP